MILEYNHGNLFDAYNVCHILLPYGKVFIKFMTSAYLSGYLFICVMFSLHGNTLDEFLQTSETWYEYFHCVQNFVEGEI